MRLETTQPPTQRATTAPRAPTPAKARQTTPSRKTRRTTPPTSHPTHRATKTHAAPQSRAPAQNEATSRSMNANFHPPILTRAPSSNISLPPNRKLLYNLYTTPLEAAPLSQRPMIQSLEPRLLLTAVDPYNMGKGDWIWTL